MNRRVLLVFGAIAVAAAFIILFLAINAGEGDATAGGTTDTTTASASDQVAPSLDGTKPRPRRANDATSDRPPPKEYIVDGQRIRDHRKGDHPPPEPRQPAVDPNNGRKLAIPVTKAIGGKFQDVFRECSKLIPKEARGGKPKLVGSLFVAIKDQQVTITGTDVKLNDVTGDTVAAAKHCIEQKAVGVSTAAANEADTDRFTIALNLSIR
jgi:hypothetical protein